MEIRFTLHSRLRMKLRGIDEKEVLKTFTESNWKETGKEGTEIAIRVLNDKELCIVYLPKTDYNLIITVYKRSKKRR